MLRNKLHESIIKTLVYSDIFNYPLTSQQVYTFLLSRKRYSFKEVVKALEQLDSYILRRGNLYVLNDRLKIISVRKKRAVLSRAKNKQARRVGRILSHIPTIQFIGISGSLSMNNCDSFDDIDLFIITRKNSLWISRFVVMVILGILRLKRSSHMILAKDLVCCNMFLSEDSLRLTSRNLYTAHEIVQVVPLVNKNHTYERFLYKNKWVTRYLGNSVIVTERNSRGSLQFIDMFLILLERMMFWLQYQFMESKITTEIVEKNRAYFHPQDKTKQVLNKYFRRLRMVQNKEELQDESLKNEAKFRHDSFQRIGIFTPGS